MRKLARRLLPSPDLPYNDFGHQAERIAMRDYEANYYTQGLRLLDLGDCPAALEHFDKALKLGLGDLAEIHVVRGEALACLHQFEAALESIGAALALKPYAASAFNARGDIYRAQGQPELAISDYTMAIHIAPEDDEAWLNRALVYEERRRFAEAEADLTQALGLNPQLGAAYEARGRLRARQFNYDGAIADIQAYLRSETGQQAENRSEMQGYLLILRAQRILWRLVSRWRR